MRSDLTKVRQILFNLISNANKFTENGLVRLQVRREDRAGKDWLVVRVSDDGIGMSQEQQQRLFEAFIQADASTTRRYGGTGLKLAISRRLARMPGGDIQVERALSQGATFSPPSHLKRRRRGPAGGSRWAPRRIRGGCVSPRYQPDQRQRKIGQVLVIDDGTNIGDLMECILTHRAQADDRFLDEIHDQIVTLLRGRGVEETARVRSPRAGRGGHRSDGWVPCSGPSRD